MTQTLTQAQKQTLDQMPAPAALLYLADIHGEGPAGAIADIVAVCDMGQLVGASKSATAALAGQLEPGCQQVSGIREAMGDAVTDAFLADVTEAAVRCGSIAAMFATFPQ